MLLTNLKVLIYFLRNRGIILKTSSDIWHGAVCLKKENHLKKDFEEELMPIAWYAKNVGMFVC